MDALVQRLAHIGLGEVLALSSAVTWALAIVIFRAVGQSLPAFELNLFKNLVGLSFLLPTALWLAGPQLPEYRLIEWGAVLLSGYLGIAVADTWYLRALQLLGAGRTGVVASLYSPFVIVLSLLFLGETLSVWQYPGFVLVLAGILLVTLRRARTEVDAPSLWLGIGFGAGAVFLSAAGIVMVKHILEQYEFFWTVVLRLLSGIVGMLIVVTWRRRWAQTVQTFQQPQRWFWVFVASVFSTYLSMMLWLGGYRYTTASVASVLNETSAAFIVVFAWLFLKEPLNGRKIAGIILALSGIAVLLGV